MIMCPKKVKKRDEKQRIKNGEGRKRGSIQK